MPALTSPSVILFTCVSVDHPFWNLLPVSFAFPSILGLFDFHLDILWYHLTITKQTKQKQQKSFQNSTSTALVFFSPLYNLSPFWTLIQRIIFLFVSVLLPSPASTLSDDWSCSREVLWLPSCWVHLSLSALHSTWLSAAERHSWPFPSWNTFFFL